MGWRRVSVSEHSITWLIKGRPASNNSLRFYSIFVYIESAELYIWFTSSTLRLVLNKCWGVEDLYGYCLLICFSIDRKFWNGFTIIVLLYNSGGMHPKLLHINYGFTRTKVNSSNSFDHSWLIYSYTYLLHIDTQENCFKTNELFYLGRRIINIWVKIPHFNYCRMWVRLDNIGTVTSWSIFKFQHVNNLNGTVNRGYLGLERLLEPNFKNLKKYV